MNPEYPPKNMPYADSNKQYTNFPQQQAPQQMLSNQMGVFAQPMVQDMALQYGAQV